MAYNDEMIKTCVDLFEKVVAVMEKHGSDRLARTFNMNKPLYYVSQGNVRDYTHGIYLDQSDPDRQTIGFVNNSELTPVAYLYTKNALGFPDPNKANLDAGLKGVQALHDELFQYAKLEANT